MVAHHKGNGPFLDDDTKMKLSIHTRRYGLIQIKEPSHPNVSSKLFFGDGSSPKRTFKAAELVAFLFCKIGTILPTCSA